MLSSQPNMDIGADWEPSPVMRARARLAQAVALRDMQASGRGWGRRVAAPAPRLQLISRMDPLWRAACGDGRMERARAAETVAVNGFISRSSRHRR